MDDDPQSNVPKGIPVQNLVEGETYKIVVPGRDTKNYVLEEIARIARGRGIISYRFKTPYVLQVVNGEQVYKASSMSVAYDADDYKLLTKGYENIEFYEVNENPQGGRKKSHKRTVKRRKTKKQKRRSKKF